MTATAFAGTPLAMKAMPGPLPIPMSRLSAVRACCSLASPAAADASISSPCLAKMPVCMPTSSGVKVQANATALPTRSFSAAPAGVTSSTARQPIRNARIRSSHGILPAAVEPPALAQNHRRNRGRVAMCHECPLR